MLRLIGLEGVSCLSCHTKVFKNIVWQAFSGKRNRRGVCYTRSFDNGIYACGYPFGLSTLSA